MRGARGAGEDAPRAAGPGAPARAWAVLVDGLAAAGTLMIGALMVFICADIVARNGFGGSLPMISELGALTLVMIVYLQLAATVRAGRLARTEIFIGPLEARAPRAAGVLTALFALVGALVLGLLAWSTVDIVAKDWGRGEFIGVRGIATLPTWPFRALILLGTAVAAVQFVIEALAALRGPADPDPEAAA